MRLKNWFSIFSYFLVGCGTLILLGLFVSKLSGGSSSSGSSPGRRHLKVSASRAMAEDKPKVAAAPSASTPVAPPEPPPVEAPAAAPEVSAAPTGKKDLGILEGIIEEFDYNGQEKRDPFAPFSGKPVISTGEPIGPVTKLESFDVDQLKVVGIIWNVPKPKAMVLDPSNNTYVVHSRDRIGRNNGYIAEIREGELVVIESFNNDGRLSYQPRIIKLQKE